MLFNLKIKTKSKKDNVTFINFFFKHILKNFYNIFYLNIIIKKLKFFFLSLLKSHFVFKKSQEQIGFFLFNFFFSIYSTKSFFFSWSLKSFDYGLFQSIFIKQFFIFKYNLLNDFFFKVFFINNFLLIFKITSYFFNLLDIFGNIFLLKFVKI